MFRIIGYGDNIGSGFQKILAAWKSLGFKRPRLEELDDVNEVWLTLTLVESNESVSTVNSPVSDGVNEGVNDSVNDSVNDGVNSNDSVNDGVNVTVNVGVNVGVNDPINSPINDPITSCRQVWWRAKPQRAPHRSQKARMEIGTARGLMGFLPAPSSRWVMDNLGRGYR